MLYRSQPLFLGLINYLEENLSTSVGVDLVKLLLHVSHGSDPLLDRGLHLLGAELLLGDTAIVTGVNAAKMQNKKEMWHTIF